MPARAAYRDKSAGTVPSMESGLAQHVADVIPKCRVVLKGFNDPHLQCLDRHSPVALRTSLHVLLQYFATHLHAGWALGTADIATAFLQGSVSASRPESLLMTPPRDPISVLAKVFPHRLYEVISSINGLADAPAMFNKHARQLLQDIGGEPHPLDCMMFVWRTNGSITCILCAHVDDLIWTRSPQHDIDSLKNTFEYGKWTESSLAKPVVLTFCGKHIITEKTAGDGTARVRLHQATFTDDLDVKASQTVSMRGRTNPKLAQHEITEYKSTVGCLQWLSSSSRPDISAGCSLLQSGVPEVGHLRGLYEHITYCKESADTGLIFYPIPLSEWILVGFSDASFNNASGERSQLALLVTLTSSIALTSTDPTRCSLLEWRSHRSRRVARSTLSAETIAGDSCIDTLQYLSAFIGVLLHNTPLRHVPGYLPWTCATDCRSLHDALAAENPSTAERRVLIDLASMRDALREVHYYFPEVPGKLLWVPSEWQLADPLTKLDKRLRSKCTSWLNNPMLRLRGHLHEPTTVASNTKVAQTQLPHSSTSM
eukprot:6479344-Amphidinium_carterae.1